MTFFKKFRLSFTAVLLFFASGLIFAQSQLPDGYARIRLGMSVDEVKDLLQKNPAFGYHGDRDVSLLPGENRILIETDAKAGHVDSFLDRCWFQFYEDRLFIITINLNKEKIDHYSIFTTLCKKYGNPGFLNPEKSVWENDSLSMSLERPLTLKYTDKTVLKKTSGQKNVEDSVPEMTAKMFLDTL